MSERKKIEKVKNCGIMETKGERCKTLPLPVFEKAGGGAWPRKARLSSKYAVSGFVVTGGTSMEIKLSPSILSADFANLARDIKIATNAGAEYVHVDVMDGHFVPNITIGAPVVKSLRKATDKVLDVHLMITDPEQYLDDFIKAGSDIITVHYESNGDTLAQLKTIRAAGVKAACVIKPKTPVEVLFPLMPHCDMVLIMTVEPGFGGQGFIPECMDKICAARAEIQKNGYSCELEIDGGAKLTNTADIVAAGADVIVAGSAVFNGDIEANVRGFHKVFAEGIAKAQWTK
ncbi:ribulose-phosphate 3-epimerase [Candidatus Agathobaculum pullicola]|uniref:ribulose-phosphate 3-epimerase n=1 Tax=Candidatus Agathobaculum pullicola TaxID=2838426 RepID=UPI003F918DBB